MKMLAYLLEANSKWVERFDMNDVSREAILAAFRAAEEHQARYAGEMDEAASQVAEVASMLDEIRGRLSAS